jgi:hypothetical protein
MKLSKRSLIVLLWAAATILVAKIIPEGTVPKPEVAIAVWSGVSFFVGVYSFEPSRRRLGDK